jgi:broad specificity phosphatase PhoE
MRLLDNEIGIHMIHLPETLHGRPFSLLIRHGERDHIVETSRALEALLTENGKREAISLGEQLAPYGTIVVHHSPVPRCKQTAEKIAEGIIRRGGSVEVAGHLVELGGPYITGNWADIVAEIDKRNFDGFVRAWFDGELPESLIAPLEVSAKLQLSILREQLVKTNASFVNVSHDWNVMCIREYYFGIRHEEAGMPAYLDGIAAIWEGNGIKLLCSGRELSLA